MAALQKVEGDKSGIINVIESGATHALESGVRIVLFVHRVK
jgi:hypothetical protein